VSESFFELLSFDSVRFGKKILRCHQYEPPMEGKYSLVVEASSRATDKYSQELYVQDFAQAVASDLPNGITITIDEPLSEFRAVSGVTISKFGDTTTASVSASFAFADWHLPSNLAHFVRAVAVRLGSETSVSTEVFTEDMSVELWVRKPLASNGNVSQGVSVLMRSIPDAYRAEMQTLVSGSREKVEVVRDLAKSDARWQWWVRYVLVPVLLGAIGLLLKLFA